MHAAHEQAAPVKLPKPKRVNAPAEHRFPNWEGAQEGIGFSQFTDRPVDAVITGRCFIKSVEHSLHLTIAIYVAHGSYYAGAFPAQQR